MSTPPTISPDAAVARLPPTARVLASPGCATPATLLAAIGRAAPGTPGRSIVGGLLLGDQPWAAAVRSGDLGLRTWHPAGDGRRLVDEGLAEYVPLRLGDVRRHLRSRVDAMVVRVSSPDDDGACNIGPSATYTTAGIAAVRAAGGVVVGEVDPDLPRTTGQTLVPAAHFDALVDADEPGPTYTPAARTAAHRRIADLVLGVLPEAATVQLGIGAVPEAVTDALAGLPAHSTRLVGMAGDGIAGLLEAGVLAAPVVAVEVLGTRALLNLVDANPAVELHPSSTVHDPRWIAGFDRFVSVNSALEIDLTGAAALEAAGGRSLSGLGGSIDFFEGAHLSRGGLRVLALVAADSRGSKIVPRLDPAAAASVPHHAVDVVVTEHGVADLRARSLRERAEALVAVAAPAHRDALAAAAGI